MRFQGKFINERGEEVEWWFEAPSSEALMQHLGKIGWRVVSFAATDIIGGPSSDKVAGTNLFRLNKKQLIAAWAFGLLWGYVFLLASTLPPSVSERLSFGFTATIIFGVFWFLMHITLKDKPKQIDRVL